MTKEQRENERIARAMSAVAYDFEFFMLSDIKDGDTKGESSVLRESEMFKELIPGWEKEKDFFNKVKLIIDYFVCIEDRERASRFASKEYVFNKLIDEKKEFVYAYATCNATDGPRKYFLKFCASRDDKGNLVGIILGVKNISEHTRVRSEEEAKENLLSSAIGSLTDDYEGVFLVNAKENTIKALKVSDFYLSFMPVDRTSTTYTERIAKVLKETIDPEDLERVTSEFDLDYIMEALENRQSFHVTYKLKRKFGRSFTCRAKFSKFNKDSYNSFILGVRFADSDVIDTVKENEKLQIQSDEALKTIDYQIRTLQEKNQELELINLEIIDMLAAVAEARDADTGSHIKKVKKFVRIIAEEVASALPEYKLTMQEIQLITDASVLHDIGKIMVPDAVLLKPGKLTPEEFDIIKLHTINGARILDMAPEHWSEEFIHYSRDICYYHHEKWDGKGYPLGLVGDDIPISAQIVSLADCFDALCTDRVYKKAFTKEVAFNMIMNGECGCFSPKLLKCFENVKEKLFKADVKEKTKRVYSTPVELSSKLHASTSKAIIVTERTMPALTALANELPMGFVMFERNGRGELVYFNKWIRDFCGYETDEAFKAHFENSFINMINPEHREELRKKFEAKLLYNEPVTFETTVETSHGEHRWIKLHARKAYGEKRHDLYYAFIEDTTLSVKYAEVEETIAKLKQSNEQLAKFGYNENSEDASNSFQGMRVLLIDLGDEFDENETSIKDILENEGAFVAKVNSGYSGTALLSRDNHFDAILIDTDDDFKSAEETIKSIRIFEGTSDHKIPIIVVTEDADDDKIEQLIGAKANGVLSKPFSVSRLSKALISSMKSRSFEMESRLADTMKKASVDPLTHVKNSTAYHDREAYINSKIKDGQSAEFAIVICDINNLKYENDKYGHAIGDIYIRNCSKIICSVFANSPVYRIGGDEFAVILTDFELRRKDELMENLEREVKVAREIDLSRNGKADFAYGIAVFNPEIDSEVEDVLERADDNMYKTKAKMKGTVIR